jgi:hypothetical protein
MSNWSQEAKGWLAEAELAELAELGQAHAARNHSLSPEETVASGFRTTKDGLQVGEHCMWSVACRVHMLRLSCMER